VPDGGTLADPFYPPSRVINDFLDQHASTHFELAGFFSGDNCLSDVGVNDCRSVSHAETRFFTLLSHVGPSQDVRALGLPFHDVQDRRLKISVRSFEEYPPTSAFVRLQAPPHWGQEILRTCFEFPQGRIFMKNVS